MPIKIIITAVFISLFACSSASKQGDTVSGASPAWYEEGESPAEIKPGARPAYKTLVAYFSKSGSTEQIAGRIALTLSADMEKIVDLDDRGFCLGSGMSVTGRSARIAENSFRPEDYDLVIIGTPIWAWNVNPSARAYINRNRGKFKNLAFFTTSGNTEPDKVVAKMEELAGMKALAFTGFVEAELNEPEKIKNKISIFTEKFLNKQPPPVK